MYKSVVAIGSTSDRHAGDWSTLRARLAKSFPGDTICDDDILYDFQDQPAFAHCGAVLLPGGVLVTAAHCIDACDERACSPGEFVAERAVFGYAMDGRGAPTRGTVAVSRMQVCEEAEAAKDDWVVLKLERPELGTAFAGKLARLGEAKGFEYQIGHFPGGLPLKVGLAEKCAEGKFKVSVLDHSSGGPVFSRAGDQLEGILIGDNVSRWRLDRSDGCVRHREVRSTCKQSEGSGTVRLAPAHQFAAAAKACAQQTFDPWPRFLGCTLADGF